MRMRHWMENCKNQNQRLEHICLPKQGNTRRLTGIGPAVAHHETAGCVSGLVQGWTEPYMQSARWPLEGYPDPALTLLVPWQSTSGNPAFCSRSGKPPQRESDCAVFSSRIRRHPQLVLPQWRSDCTVFGSSNHEIWHCPTCIFSCTDSTKSGRSQQAMNSP
jgi:hypothetical protein